MDNSTIVGPVHKIHFRTHIISFVKQTQFHSTSLISVFAPWPKGQSRSNWQVNLYGIVSVQNGRPLKSAALFGRTPRTCLRTALVHRRRREKNVGMLSARPEGPTSLEARSVPSPPARGSGERYKLPSRVRGRVRKISNLAHLGTWKSHQTYSKQSKMMVFVNRPLIVNHAHINVAMKLYGRV